MERMLVLSTPLYLSLIHISAYADINRQLGSFYEETAGETGEERAMQFLYPHSICAGVSGGRLSLIHIYKGVDKTSIRSMLYGRVERIVEL